MLERTITWLNGLATPGLTAGDLRDKISGLARLQGALDACNNRLAVALQAAVGEREGIEVVRESTGCSRREARRRSERAAALNDMPNISEALGEGRITTEHADALVKAAKDTDAATVDGDSELLDLVSEVPADKAGKHTEDWARRRQSPEDLEAAHRRARAKRRVDFFPGEDHMLRGVITGDNTTMAMIQAKVLDMAQRLHSSQGGRDNPKHDRTWAQYRYDAMLIALGIDPFPPAPARTQNGRTSIGDREPSGDSGLGAAGGTTRSGHGTRRPGTHRQNGHRQDGHRSRHRSTSNGQHHKSGNQLAPSGVMLDLLDSDRPTGESASANNGLSLPGITGTSPNGTTVDGSGCAGGESAGSAGDASVGERYGTIGEMFGSTDPQVGVLNAQHSHGDPCDARSEAAGNHTGLVDEQNSHDHRNDSTDGSELMWETQDSCFDDGAQDSGGQGCVCGGGKLSQRNQIVVVAQLDDLADTNQGTLGGLIPGTGPISRSELERLACDADLQGLIFNGRGEPLWLGRRRRSASAAQLKALIARDRGCVLCDASPHHCHAHHIVPWQNDGPTDIDNLALVCHQDHTKIHDRQLRLKRHPDGKWTTTHDPTMVKTHNTS